MIMRLWKGGKLIRMALFAIARFNYGLCLQSPPAVTGLHPAGTLLFLRLFSYTLGQSALAKFSPVS